MKSDKASPESCKVCCTTAELARYLFKIYFRGSVCHLCINCLLKNHHGLFCPICFDVYKDTPPPPHLHLMCLKCPSIAHRSCVVDVFNFDAPIPAFHCPSCADPKFSYFKFAQKADGKEGFVFVSAQNAEGEGNSDSVSSPDGESAKALDAAPRIAAFSMRKALSAAMIDAERRMEEAALARKKVKEALDHVASLFPEEKDCEEAKNADGKGGPVDKDYVIVPAQDAHGEGDSVSGLRMALDAAEWIAASSVRKALSAAVIDAKQRMEEAALASKKVPEALDYVASLLPKEKDTEEDST